MTFVVDGTVAALVTIIIQVLLKPLLEIWLKPDAPNHDTAVRAMALVLGVLLLALDTLIGGPWPATGNAWLLLIGSGALSGVSAVGAYHIFSGSATPADVPAGGTRADPVPVDVRIDYARLAGELAAVIAPPAVKPGPSLPSPEAVKPIVPVGPIGPEPAIPPAATPPQSPPPGPAADAAPPAQP